MPPNDDNIVHSVRRTFRILEAVTETEDATLETLSQEVNLSTSAVHNHLVTLEREGFLVKDDGTYRASLKFLELGGKLRSRTELYRKGRTKVDNLAAETGELANLMIEEQGQGIHLYLSKGDDAVVFDTHTGRRYSLHNNALGKAILANIPEERADRIIEEMPLTARTDNTITDRESLRAELESIRERGIAFDDEERIDGLRCVAAPIIVEGEVIGSVSVSGPSSRIKGQRFNEAFPETVERAADLIGIDINYS
jgi:DNA-binding IclR family transcriptional regulator